MRRALALLSALVLTMGLASCGKGQRNVTETVTTQAAAPHSSGHGSTKEESGAESPGKTQALAFARAVNLRAGDVPGFQATPKEEKSSPGEHGLEHELQRCLGAPLGASALAEAGSVGFKRSASIAEQTIGSNITVSRSSAVAKNELKALQSSRGRSCMGHFLEGLLHGKGDSGAQIGPVSIAHGTPPAPGTTGSFGLRVKTSLTVRTVRIPYYMDILGFTEGPAQVVLLSTGLPTPVPAATEQHLFLLLLARAKAHPLR